MRKVSIVIMVVASIAVGFDASAQGAPPNDSCVDAIPLACNTPTAFSTLGATDDGNFSCGPGTAEIWYTLSCCSGGTIRCSTCYVSTDFDTVLNASTGDCGSLDELVCNDDGGGGPCPLGSSGSWIFWSGAPATTYWIGLGGVLGATGTGTVACECSPAAAFCGDGNMDAGEDCDDGNNTSGDGCSAMCMTEVPTLGQWGAFVLALVLLGLGALGAQTSSRRRSV